MKYRTDVFTTDQRAEVRAEKWRYDISLVQTEQAMSIGSLLYDHLVKRTKMADVFPFF